MSNGDNLPWTTARCNRLLRPISSRLTILRKELENRRRAAAEARNVSSKSEKKDSPRKAYKFKEQRPRGFEKSTDPDWLPGAKQGGGSKRTYGRRVAKRSDVSQSSSSDTLSLGRPGEIAVSTPFISRTIGRLQDSPQMQDSPLQHGKRRKPPVTKPVEQLQALRKEMTPEMWKQINGLFEAYANLLQATKAGEEKSRKGTRSLMDTCLRQVPTQIALEEYFAELDKEEDDDTEEKDVSSEMYTYLEEQFGTRTGYGWRSLKGVVRAHGTSLLCDAFENRILGLDALEGIYSLCMNVSAWDEAEKFLGTFLLVLRPLPPPTSLQADLFESSYMRMVKNFVDVTWRHQFLYAQLEYMVSQELLPLEWLATQSMRPIWSRIVRTLSDQDHRTYANAFRFLETALCAGAGLPDDSLLEEGDVQVVTKQFKPSSRPELREALNTTSSSLLTLLSSITLVSHTRAEDTDHSTVQSVTWVLDALVVGFLKRGDIRSDLELLAPFVKNMDTFAQRALWTVAASFLVHLGGCQMDQEMISVEISTLIPAFNWIVDQYSSEDIDVSSILESLPTFISSTARCSGKAWKDDGFDQLQRLIDALLSTTGTQLSHKLWNLKRVALDSCLEFAESTNDAEHFAYARQIEKTLSKRFVFLKSPSKAEESPATRSGFQWEEGIGEWIACTPFVRQEAKYIPKRPMRAMELLPTPTTSESEHDTTDNSMDAMDDAISEQDATLDDDQPLSSPVKPPAPEVRRGRLRKHANKRSLNETSTITAKRPCLTPADSPAYTSFEASTLQDHSAADADTETEASAPKRSKLAPKRLLAEPSIVSSKRTRLTSCDSSASTSASISFLQDPSTDTASSGPAQPRRKWRNLKQTSGVVDSLRTPRSRKSLRSARNISENEDEDELAIAVERPRISKRGRAGKVKRRKRPRAERLAQEGESEDELSFQ